MAKRILLLLESTDWIVMAGAYQRWKKHSVEAVIVPFNDEGLAQIGPDTTHLYLLTHGLPGVLLGSDVKDVGTKIAARLTDKQHLKLKLDVCYSAAGSQQESLAKQVHDAIKQDRPECALAISAYEGPVIPGWAGKRGYVVTEAAKLVEAIQNYLQEVKHLNNTNLAKHATAVWCQHFNEADSVNRTAQTAKAVNRLTKPLFADFETFLRYDAKLSDGDLRGLFIYIRKHDKMLSGKHKFDGLELSVDEQLVKLRALVSKSLNHGNRKLFP